MKWLKRWQPVDDWREAATWLSMQAMAVNTAFLSVWALVPQKFQDALGEKWVFGIAIALLVLGMFGRLTAQQKPTPTPEIPAAEKLSE